MYYIHILLQKLGTWGMIASYLLALFFIILLYLGVVAKDQLEQADRTILAIVLFFTITYTYARHFYASGKFDESLFYTYPITTLTEIKNNAQSQGGESFYIGKVAKMADVIDWQTLREQYGYAKNIMTAYDPSVNKNRQSIKLFGQEKVLGIKYKNGLAQFMQIEPASNDLFEAVEFITPFVNGGVRVAGDFERLKNVPPQFTTKNWIKMIAIIFVVVVSFMLVSVFIAGLQDSMR